MSGQEKRMRLCMQRVDAHKGVTMGRSGGGVVGYTITPCSPVCLSLPPLLHLPPPPPGHNTCQCVLHPCGALLYPSSPPFLLSFTRLTLPCQSLPRAAAAWCLALALECVHTRRRSACGLEGVREARGELVGHGAREDGEMHAASRRP